MSGYRRVNYYELCRLCTSSEGMRMNIFRDEGPRRQLQTKIESYLPIQVHEEDSLPKVVCHDCVRKLETYIEFRDTVVSAESMLESYFTSLRISDDFLKEGKVYVKSTEKERPTTPQSSPQQQDDPLKSMEKLPGTGGVGGAGGEVQLITQDPGQTQQHQQPVVVGNVNASNIQIISGVQARVQQYKCAMQMQPGGVAAAVVEATAETHYSYQQQTSQQVSPQENSSHGQARITEQAQGQLHQVQNQIQSQSQMSQQLQRQVPQQQQQSLQQQQQQQQQVQIVQQQSQSGVVSQQQGQQAQINQQIQQLQRQQREYEKQQRHLQEIEKQQVQITSHQQQDHQQASQQQLHLQHQNNNVLMKSEVVAAEQQTQQITLKVEAESQNIGSPTETVQTYTTVQASPEVFLSLGLTPQQSSQRADDVKEFKDYIKASPDDGISRNSIGQISEFLRIRSCPEAGAPLITVNAQAICQTSRAEACGDCGKSFDNPSDLNSHQCPASPLISDVSDIGGKEDNAPSNGNCFSCDICGKPFKRKEHLFQHRKLHTGERPYVCTTCTKAFSRKEHLVRHSVSHTGQKMHECEMCGKSFSRKDNLHKHRKTHGVSGPYICETCGKSFVVKHYYLMHLTTHAPSIIDGAGVQDPLPYKCDLCHKAFSVKQYLTTHKLRHRSKPNAANAAANAQQQQTTVVATPGASNNDVNPADNPTSMNNNNNNNNSSSGNNQTNVESPVVEIQNVIERNAEQNHATFENNQYHGNVQQFQ